MEVKGKCRGESVEGIRWEKSGRRLEQMAKSRGKKSLTTWKNVFQSVGRGGNF